MRGGGDNTQRAFYSFLGTAIAKETSQKTSINSTIGPTLGDLFGPGSGYGVAPQKNGQDHHELTFYASTMLQATEELNSNARRAGEPNAVNSELIETINQVILKNEAFDSPLTIQQLSTLIKQHGGHGGGFDSQTIDTITNHMLQGIPYKGSLADLHSHIANTLPSSLGLGGAGAGEITIGSIDLILHAIKKVNTKNTATGKSLISSDTENTLLNAAHSTTDGLTLDTIQTMCNDTGLIEELQTLMKGEFSKTRRMAAPTSSVHEQEFNQFENDVHSSHSSHSSVHHATNQNEGEETALGGTFSTPQVPTNTPKRRVKETALSGDELFDVFRHKLAAFGMFHTLVKRARKRKHAHVLLSSGVFTYLLRAKVQQRRALRLCALGLMYSKVSRQRKNDVSCSLISMGFFMGLQTADQESQKKKAAQASGGGSRSRYEPKTLKGVNLSKEDIVDEGSAQKSVWGIQKKQRNRRDSFMTLATKSLEEDFALKQRPTPNPTPGPIRPKKAGILPDDKDGKKMGFVAFALVKTHTWEELANIIEDLEVEALSIESLEALVAVCPLIAKFTKKVMNWKPDKKNPPTTEAHFKLMSKGELMVYHLSQVDNFKESVESMLFVKSFDDQYKPLDRALNVLIAASKEIIASTRLPNILRYGKTELLPLFYFYTA